RLLGHSQECDLKGRGQLPRLTGDHGPGVDAGLLGELGRRALERLGEATTLQRFGAERPDELPRLPQRVARNAEPLLEVADHFPRTRAQGCLSRLEQYHDAGERLRERVVDLAGEALALLEDSGATLRPRQLFARRLEGVDELLASIALLGD